MSGETKPTLGDAPTMRVSVNDLPRPAEPVSGARYREHGVLGRGGMGEVRLVEDRLIGREVAVKTIAGSLEGDASTRDRFLREVRIQGQLEHPSIVPVYDLGVDASGADYFTMKRIAGRTLASELRDSKSSRNGLLALFRQVCLTVAYAHSRGVIHRDLKPANIMIGDFGEVYVLDWGIARLVNEPASDTDDILGTPGYMAPEQVADADAAREPADVYALGAILFEILTLEPLHPRTSTAEAIASTTTLDRGRPAERAPDVAPELDELCARATAREVSARIGSARELADAIERYLEGDRDLERRRELAKQHARAAREAHARVIAGGDAAIEARREALREAGHAVALDPQEREGLRAAIELMLQPPPEVPAEVSRELEVAQSERIRAGLAPALVVLGTFMVAALVVPLIAGPVSWRIPLIVAGSMLLASVLCASLLGRDNLSTERWATVAIVASTSVAIAFASGYMGPMMLIPPLAVALANALAASQLRWRVLLLLTLLGVVVPAIAEWAGWGPRSYEFSHGSLLVRPVTMQLAETPIRLLSLFVTLAALVGSVFYVRRVILVEAELRRTWLLHNWHLRQMARVD